MIDRKLLFQGLNSSPYRTGVGWGAELDKFVANSNVGYRVSLDLKRGNYGSIQLKKIYFTVFDAIDNSVLLERREFRGVEKFGLESLRENGERIRLSPGDKKTFSEVFLLETENPIKADILIVARRDWGISDAQWRVNTIYIPQIPTEASH